MFFRNHPKKNARNQSERKIGKQAELFAQHLQAVFKPNDFMKRSYQSETFNKTLSSFKII